MPLPYRVGEEMMYLRSVNPATSQVTYLRSVDLATSRMTYLRNANPATSHEMRSQHLILTSFRAGCLELSPSSQLRMMEARA